MVKLDKKNLKSYVSNQWLIYKKHIKKLRRMYSALQLVQLETSLKKKSSRSKFVKIPVKEYIFSRKLRARSLELY